MTCCPPKRHYRTLRLHACACTACSLVYTSVADTTWAEQIVAHRKVEKLSSQVLLLLCSQVFTAPSMRFRAQEYATTGSF